MARSMVRKSSGFFTATNVSAKRRNISKTRRISLAVVPASIETSNERNPQASMARKGEMKGSSRRFLRRRKRAMEAKKATSMPSACERDSDVYFPRARESVSPKISRDMRTTMRSERSATGREMSRHDVMRTIPAGRMIGDKSKRIVTNPKKAVDMSSIRKDGNSVCPAEGFEESSFIEGCI